MVPGRRLLGLMLAGLLVAVLPAVVHASLWPLVVVMWAAAAGLAAADTVMLLLARPALGAKVPAVMGVGESCDATVDLDVMGRRSLRASVLFEVEGPIEEPGAHPTLVTPDGSRERISLRATRRGKAGVRATWVRWFGPLGFVDRIVRYPNDAAVTVVPNVSLVRRFAMQHVGSDPQPGGSVLTRSRGSGRELDTLEAFQPGMDVRDVDWKVSARHQSPFVRRYRFERNERIVVCLDTGRLMGDSIEGITRLDHAVHAALLLGFAALRAGDLVGMHAYGQAPRIWLPPVSGVRHMHRLTEACARLHPEQDETNHARGIRDLLTRLKRRSLVVILTDFVDSTTAALMVDHLGILARRHLVLFVALDDPQVEAPLEREPGGLSDVASGVVASTIRADRRRVLRRLERLGANVIHAPPGPAALAMVARYVEIKRKGLIG